MTTAYNIIYIFNKDRSIRKELFAWIKLMKIHSLHTYSSSLLRVGMSRNTGNFPWKQYFEGTYAFVKELRPPKIDSHAVNGRTGRKANSNAEPGINDGRGSRKKTEGTT